MHQFLLASPAHRAWRPAADRAAARPRTNPGQPRYVGAGATRYGGGYRLNPAGSLSANDGTGRPAGPRRPRRRQ